MEVFKPTHKWKVKRTLMDPHWNSPTITFCCTYFSPTPKYSCVCVCVYYFKANPRLMFISLVIFRTHLIPYHPAITTSNIHNPSLLLLLLFLVLYALLLV